MTTRDVLIGFAEALACIAVVAAMFAFIALMVYLSNSDRDKLALAIFAFAMFITVGVALSFDQASR